MTGGLGLWGRLRGETPELTSAAGPASDRSPRQMIAGCEYELRQLRRGVTETRTVMPAERSVSREPFVLGAKLRDAAYRARLADVAEGGPAATLRDSSGNGTTD